MRGLPRLLVEDETWSTLIKNNLKRYGLVACGSVNATAEV